jgi:hypothetical protein
MQRIAEYRRGALCYRCYRDRIVLKIVYRKQAFTLNYVHTSSRFCDRVIISP